MDMQTLTRAVEISVDLGYLPVLRKYWEQNSGGRGCNTNTPDVSSQSVKMSTTFVLCVKDNGDGITGMNQGARLSYKVFGLVVGDRPAKAQPRKAGTGHLLTGRP